MSDLLAVSELQPGVRSGLDELVGNKPRLRTDFALTLLPRLRIKSQAIEEHRTSSLRHTVPLSIDRAGGSLDLSFILHLVVQRRKRGEYGWRRSIRVLITSHVNLSRKRAELTHSRPLPKSLEMDRQFPPEIIQLIVEASLDPRQPSYGENEPFKLRYAILKKYSVLNSTWRGVSELLLYNWVILTSMLSTRRFLKMVAMRGGTLDEVRELRISWEAANASSISSVLRATRRVTNLVILGGAVSIDDLAQLQQLRHLELTYVDVLGSPASSTLSLPLLQHLQLRYCTISPPHFLAPPFLPQLRHLEFLGGAAVPTTLAPLISQLQVLHVRRDDYGLFRAAANLRLLVLPMFASDRLGVLDNLSYLPTFLSVQSSGGALGSDQQVADTLRELLATTKIGLRVVLLHNSGIDDAVKVLIKQLEGRAIRVVREEQELDFDGAIRAMERVLAEEQRVEKKREEKTSAMGRRSN